MKIINKHNVEVEIPFKVGDSIFSVTQYFDSGFRISAKEIEEVVFSERPANFRDSVTIKADGLMLKLDSEWEYPHVFYFIEGMEVDYVVYFSKKELAEKYADANKGGFDEERSKRKARAAEILKQIKDKDAEIAQKTIGYVKVKEPQAKKFLEAILDTDADEAIAQDKALGFDETTKFIELSIKEGTLKGDVSDYCDLIENFKEKKNA